VTALFLLFGFLALGLAAVGLFGVLAYLGAQRAREMAIRMALGAQVGQIWRLVLGQGLKLTLIGVLVGLGAATALVKLLSSLLFEIQPYDPLTFLVVPVLLGLVAVTAGLAPALRAGRVDPVVALRQE